MAFFDGRNMNVVSGQSYFNKKRPFYGFTFFSYLSWYGVGRFFIEGLRTDSLYIGVFRISQVLGFICFIVGAGLLIYGLVIARRKALEGADYEPVYKNFTKRGLPTKKEEEKTVDNAKSADSINEALNNELNYEYKEDYHC